MKSFGLLILSTLLLNLSNCQTECPKTEAKPQTKGKPAEKERNISLKELIRNIYNRYKKSQCDCGSNRCFCQNLKQASVVPCLKELFKILLNQNTGCKEKTREPCIPIDETNDELDYRTWVEELKNHKVKLYRTQKKCDFPIEKPEKPKAPTQVKIREREKCKREDDTISADCTDCNVVVSEDKQSVWLICNNCKKVTPDDFKEFTKTGCLIKCSDDGKTIKVKACYLQLNDYRDERTVGKTNPFVCPSISFHSRRKKICSS